MSRPVAWIVLALLLTPLCGLCQDEGAPEIDRTDPAAVAEAYAEACRMGEVETALELVHPDDPLQPMLDQAARVMGGGAEQMGFSYRRIFTEFMFAPMAFGFEVGDATVEQVEDGATQVTLKRTWAVDQKLVMSEADDGTWSIKALDSVKATTGSNSSFLQMQMGAMAGGGQGGPPSMRMLESENHLHQLAGAFREYADDHNNILPPAESWVDAIEPYVLDRDLFVCPGAPEQEYGYAMNVMAGEIELPQDWNDKRGIILLFEWRGAERNAAAMPEELADMEAFWPDGTIVLVGAAQNTRRVAQGVTIAELAAADEHLRKCEQNVLALTRAALRHARENDGLLPGPDTWQDDIAPYLLDETGVDDIFRCPAAKGIDFAYAINSEIAGMDATEIRGHDRITLFFESDQNAANASGDPDLDGAAPARHLVEWDSRRRNTGGTLNGSTTHLHAPAGGR